MNQRLQFTPKQYKEKFTAYSQDSIDFESLNGLFRYKVNRNDNPTVVEVVDDYFRIYLSLKPAISVGMIIPRQSDYRMMFLAKVFISESNIDIRIFWNRFYKTCYLIGAIFLVGFEITMLAKENFGALFFIPFYLTAFIFIAFSKRRYKRFIIHFMNNL